MDLKALREEVLDATSRALWDKYGSVPSEDSEEWEEEFRRQFARLKQLHAGDGPVAPPRPTAAPAVERQWPELSGTPEQKRWAATIRTERLREVPNEPLRVWFAGVWPRSKVWIDTRDVPTAVLLKRLEPQYAEYRRQAAETAKARAADAEAKAAAFAAHQARLKEAGVTPEGLAELIDASERADPAPIAAKIAELTLDRRNLRVFETTDPNVLLIKEKNGPVNSDYGIESDDGLIADLKLFAQAPGG
jgi:hypothetical protein